MRRTSLVAAAGAILASAVFGFGGPSFGGVLETDAAQLCKLKGIRYVGKTSQGKKLCFTLWRSGKRISEYGFGFRDNCGASGTSRTTVSKGIPIAADGRFSSGSGTPTFFAGRVSGRIASGSLAVVTNQLPLCRINVRWTTRRATG